MGPDKTTVPKDGGGFCFTGVTVNNREQEWGEANRHSQ